VAPNGYHLPKAPARAPEPETAVVVGHWDYYPNRSGLARFLDRVWPLVRTRHPGAQLWVVGRGTRPYRERDDGLTWVGEVEALAPWYARASVALAPVYVGAGTKTKIMEALFYGVPVIAPVEAVEGIEPNPYLHAVASDEQFAQALSEGFAQPWTWEPTARTDFLKRHTWTETLKPLICLIDGEAPLP
jgi:glycosyltransferase involved in cell wall biosynthesis